jgi:hypothetical protein
MGAWIFEPGTAVDTDFIPFSIIMYNVPKNGISA